MKTLIVTKEELSKRLNENGVECTDDLLNSLISLCEIKEDNGLNMISYFNEEVRLLKNNVANKFISSGGVNLKGLEVNRGKDIAQIYKIFSDSRYETFRIAFVKDGKIVRTEAISSKLPGLSKVSKYYGKNVTEIESVKRFYNELKYKVKSEGIDSYYLIHNHPSGAVEFSADDISSTLVFISQVPGFKAHIVLGDDKARILTLKPGGYEWFMKNKDINAILKDGDILKSLFATHVVQIRDESEASQVTDPQAVISVKNPREIKDEIVDYAKYFLNTGKSLLILGKNGRETPVETMIITSVYDIDNSDFNNRELAGRIKNLKTQDGAMYAFIVTGNLLAAINAKNFNYMISNGQSLLLDIIYYDAEHNTYASANAMGDYISDKSIPYLKVYNKH